MTLNPRIFLNVTFILKRREYLEVLVLAPSTLQELELELSPITTIPACSSKPK